MNRELAEHVLLITDNPSDMDLDRARELARTYLEEVADLQRWKAEALPILNQYSDIASTCPSKLGDSLVEALRQELERLRRQHVAQP